VAGDPPVLTGVTRFSGRYLVSYLCNWIAFRQKIRKDALEQRAINDEEIFRNNLNNGREIANFLRKNIVQAERLQKAPGEDTEAYSACRWLLFRIIL
jgi:5-bromo-4-chloroindolyl phosphate hydrolysis protein